MLSPSGRELKRGRKGGVFESPLPRWERVRERGRINNDSLLKPQIFFLARHLEFLDLLQLTLFDHIDDTLGAGAVIG
jgi:hypothetical protein